MASAPGTAVDTLRATIAQVLGRKYRLRILFAGELLAYLVGEVRGAFAGVHALGALVLVVVLVGMADTLAAGVAERTRQLGTLRAMGVQRRALRRMIMLEALALGGLGLVLAVTGGFTLGAFWVEATLPHLLGWILALHLPWAQAGLVAAATVAVCLLAALLPARKAAHLAPAVALRYE